MQVERPNQAWVSDITYIRLRDGFAYLSLLTDYYSRKVVGWCLSRSFGLDGSLQALHQALSVTRRRQGLVHHSDRGIQYYSAPYTSQLQQHGIRISMTEVDHCYENALAERVNGILKDEYALDATFSDYNQACQSCKEAIRLYNTRRPHWSLGFKTPEEVHRAA
jgi:putative transposase